MISPSDEPAGLLALRHFDNFEFGNLRFLQQSGEWLEAGFFLHEAGEPQALFGEIHALPDHSGDKADFATRAPEFGILAAEIEFGRLALAKIAPLALRALFRLCKRRMERGVAEGDIETIIPRDDALKDILGVVLMFEPYIQPVSFADLPCRFDRDRIDIDAREVPTIFMPTRQRIDKARTRPDIDPVSIK